MFKVKIHLHISHLLVTEQLPSGKKTTKKSSLKNLMAYENDNCNFPLHTETIDVYLQRRGNLRVAVEFEEVTGYYGNIKMKFWLPILQGEITGP